MRSVKPQGIRNKIELHDATQVRVLKRRLKITEEDLGRIVKKVGNSIATVSKEVELEKATKSPAQP